MAEKLCSTEAVLTGRKSFTVLGEIILIHIFDSDQVTMTTPILCLTCEVHSTLIVPDGTLSGEWRVGVSFIGCGWVGMYIENAKKPHFRYLPNV